MRRVLTVANLTLGGPHLREAGCRRVADDIRAIDATLDARRGAVDVPVTLVVGEPELVNR